jgi:4-hydroxybenzoyl-CoA reductase subunit beta
MDGFITHRPQTPEEAVELYHSLENPMYIAGGTDLLPNLKHRIFEPKNLVAIGRAVPKGWELEGKHWAIGAGTRLSQLAKMTEIPPLAQAAGLVAGPQIRNMGTIGGNVLLDTRCIYYNQTEFWRKSLGYCLKATGDWCHVINSAKTCVATQSSDTVPVLLAMNASIRLLGPEGCRELNLRELFHFDGKDHLKIEKGELLTHVLVPCPGDDFRGSYTKIRTRDSIDFPLLGVAITGDLSGEGPTCRARKLSIVIGAINPAPRLVKGLDAFSDVTLDDETIAAISELSRKRSRPQGSIEGPIHGTSDWRRVMVEVTVRRALKALRDSTQ